MALTANEASYNTVLGIVISVLLISSTHTAGATVQARYPKFIPFSTLFNVYGILGWPVTVTLKYLHLLRIFSSQMATIPLHWASVLCLCYDGKFTNWTLSWEIVVHFISLDCMPSCQRQMYATLWQTSQDNWLIESKSKLTCSQYSSCQP